MARLVSFALTSLGMQEAAVACLGVAVAVVLLEAARERLSQLVIPSPAAPLTRDDLGSS